MAISEQVIVASARRREDGLPHITYVAGALEHTDADDQGIRQHVCRILEGGTDAFLKERSGTLWVALATPTKNTYVWHWVFRAEIYIRLRALENLETLRFCPTSLLRMSGQSSPRVNAYPSRGGSNITTIRLLPHRGHRNRLSSCDNGNARPRV